MTKYTATTKNGDRVTLFSDDTFTLAFGNPNTEFTETTARDLADSFILRVLRNLGKRVHANYLGEPDGIPESKIEHAIFIAKNQIARERQ